MKRFAEIVVEKRKIILLLFVILIAYCLWGMTQSTVEYSIENYLPQNTDTRKAITIMDEEFTTYGTATLMVRNVTFEEAEELHIEIESLDGVKSLTFNNTPDYYKDSCALFSITFEGDDEDALSVSAYNKVLEMVEGRDILVSTPLVDNYAEELQSDVNFVLILAVIVIIAVLTFTSKSFAEVPVFLITFIVAAVLNMGTNYWLGTISFISNSVCVILQLALAIDYAIILCHRFSEEKEKNGGNSAAAMKVALRKAVPEICGSSLTTISGLLALTTMALGLGADLGIVLAKSIICSMITVFLFMPGLMMLFSKPIDKTKHRNLVPKISFVGKVNVKLRYVIPAVFLGLVAACTYFSFQTEYVYSEAAIDTDRPSSEMVAQTEIERVFGYSNQFVILMPGKDYDAQKTVLDMVEAHEEIDLALGIANTELTMNKHTYYLSEGLNYKEFASFIGASTSVADSIYRAYAFLSQDDTRGGMEELAIYEANKDRYHASVLELADCAFEYDDFIYAYLSDDSDALENYEDIRDTIQDAEAQLIGENYCRLLFNIASPSESQETFSLISVLLEEVKAYCPEAIFAGSSMSAYDLNQSFTMDNIKVSLLTILFVFIVLIFTFRSWGLPIPLTLTIQGAIFINFSYYALFGVNLFFFVYLIVSTIQMGATIDYAIVVTNRYTELKKTMDNKKAMIEAINQAFPTIITSGTIMATAGFLIGGIVGNPLIATLGLCLGRGVIISILSVMFVLPTLLLIFDKPISKTFFKERQKVPFKERLKAIKTLGATDLDQVELTANTENPMPNPPENKTYSPPESEPNSLPESGLSKIEVGEIDIDRIYKKGDRR